MGIKAGILGIRIRTDHIETDWILVQSSAPMPC